MVIDHIMRENTKNWDITFYVPAILMASYQSRQPRLKPLLDAVPPGFVVDTPWLRARGIDPKSIHNYVARGWIERIVRGVYRRPLPEGVPTEDKLSWTVLLISLQRLMNYSVHLGGENALDLAGHRHYLRLGGWHRIHLCGEVPSWLRRLPLAEKIVTRPNKLFGDDSTGIEDSRLGMGALFELWGWRVRLSSPERAILEMLNEVPQRTSFDHLDKIFDGLVLLRPKVLSKLLYSCQSVKVRRLFFVFADRHQHPWRKHLDTSKIDFGSGPRALVKGGRFHPTYGITIPQELMPFERSDVNTDF